MRKRVLLAFAWLLILAARTVAAEEPADPCAMGGYRVGQAAPDMAEKSRWLKQKPTIYRPEGGKFIFDTTQNVYLRIAAGKVTHVIREWEGDEASRVYGSLVERFGEPDSPVPISPTVKSSYGPFVGSVKLESRAAWETKACATHIEFIKQDKTTFTGFGGGSAGRVAVAISAGTGVEGGPTDPLR